MKPTAQQCHAMTTYYATSYKEKFGRTPVVNRNKARWGFEAILTDMTAPEAQTLIDWWLSDESAKAQDLDWFFYNYDKLIVLRQEEALNRARRKELMAESAKRVAEWRARGNKTITEE